MKKINVPVLVLFAAITLASCGGGGGGGGSASPAVADTGDGTPPPIFGL